MHLKLTHMNDEIENGVIATRTFRAGEIVATYDGDLITIEEADVRAHKLDEQDKYLHYFEFGGSCRA